MMSRPLAPESLRSTRERLQRARSACADLLDRFGATPHGRISPTDPFGSMTMQYETAAADMTPRGNVEVDG